MELHKNTRLTPIHRAKVYSDYYEHRLRICDLTRKYLVTAPTIYKILERGRHGDFMPHKSINKRFRCLQFGLKRLAKVEHKIEEKLRNKARRYNKDYPGQMLHFDTKRLPMLEGQSSLQQREYLFVGIDDFSRELYAAIMTDKTQYSAMRFMEQVIEECAYTIELSYSDNGKEFKGNPDHHAFMKVCTEHKIEQRFTRIKRPQTNGKAERVIRTLMEMWHIKTKFNSPAHRKTELKRFVNFYNCVKPHASLDGLTPIEKLIEYFFPDKL